MKSFPPFIISLIVVAWSLSCHAGDTKTTDNTVYYLAERISVTAETGIFSLPAGTKLLVVSATQNGLDVKTTDGITLQVKLSQVTRDPDLAAKLAEQEAAKISAQQTKAAAEAQEFAEKQQQAKIRQEQALDRVATATATPAPVIFSKMPGSALDNPPPATFKMRPPPPKKK